MFALLSFPSECVYLFIYLSQLSEGKSSFLTVFVQGNIKCAEGVVRRNGTEEQMGFSLLSLWGQLGKQWVSPVVLLCLS